MTKGLVEAHFQSCEANRCYHIQIAIFKWHSLHQIVRYSQIFHCQHFGGWTTHSRAEGGILCSIFRKRAQWSLAILIVVSSQYEQKRFEKNVLTFSPWHLSRHRWKFGISSCSGKYIWEVGRQQEVKLEAGFFVQGVSALCTVGDQNSSCWQGHGLENTLCCSNQPLA